MTNYLPAILREQEKLLSLVDLKQTERFCRELSAAERVFFTAAGRTMLMARALAMRLMHLGYEVYVEGDTTTPALGKGICW